jgi:hypothetical protein
MMGSSTLDEIRSGLECNFNVTMLVTNNLLPCVQIQPFQKQHLTMF